MNSSTTESTAGKVVVIKGASSGVDHLGSWIGAMALAQPVESPDVAPNSEDKLSGELLGRRVAQLISK